MILNDLQSRLNETNVLQISAPGDIDEVALTITDASNTNTPISVAGALHSMGGQQFADASISLSSRNINKIESLDQERRLVKLQSGVTWPDLVRWLKENQIDSGQELGIIQKQTGADDLTIGGALSSNIHGRVLTRKPIVDDVEGFHITTADGRRSYCSRSENADLFGAVIGGYGLFGFIDSVDLKLTERVKLKRTVSENSLDEVIPALEERIENGATFGDFQYMTDEKADGFLSKGVLSTYSPVDPKLTIPDTQLGLTMDDWKKLFVLAHTDKKQAYELYLGHYIQTNDQIYWSDEHQFSTYLPQAGDMLNQQLKWDPYASLMISELYVPRDNFVDFMRDAREGLLKTSANVIYGTVRLIKSEKETFLNWAKDDFACIIFNLLVEHSPNGIEKAKGQFRMLIDCALNYGGSYYLTYHRWARKDQVEAAYPQFTNFLEKKNYYDPSSVFTSNWHRHYADMFS